MRQVGENRRSFETPMAGDSTDRNSLLSNLNIAILLDSCDYPAASIERVQKGLSFLALVGMASFIPSLLSG